MSIKVSTFNVNSVKSRLPILESWLTSEAAPDILCLQETKCRDEDFPQEFFELLGYHCAFRGMKAYNGVAIVSKAEPDEICFGFGDSGAPPEKQESENARVARARFGDLDVLNTYVPQGREITHEEYQYKLRFFERILALLERNYTDKGKVLWVGDLNVAPTDADVTNPEAKREHVCCHSDVRDAFAQVMSWGLTDIFRKHRPGAGEFTFWDYRVRNSLSRNIGWRIDHILGTEAAAGASKGVIIHRDLRAMERPSDHTAVTGIFDF